MPRNSSFHRGRSRAAAWWAGALVCLGTTLPMQPASAQMLGDFMSRLAGPFAGRVAPNGSQMAPLYGSQAGATPHLLQGTTALAQTLGGASNAAAATSGSNLPNAPQPGMEMTARGKADAPDADVGEPTIEVLIGACAGGAFIGGFSAVTAAIPIGVTLAAAPLVATAMATGCGVGIATAAVSLGAVAGWQRAVR